MPPCLIVPVLSLALLLRVHPPIAASIFCFSSFWSTVRFTFPSPIYSISLRTQSPHRAKFPVGSMRRRAAATFLNHARMDSREGETALCPSAVHVALGRSLCRTEQHDLCIPTASCASQNVLTSCVTWRAPPEPLSRRD
ncbi:hypothetical protein IWZ01DRAFT_308232 [Phyllosticta capitalensis]